MTVLSIILAVVDILICLAIIMLVVAQEGHDRGMGAIMGGSTDTFYNRNASRGKDKMMKKMTLILSIAFVVITIALYSMVAIK